MVAPWGGPHDLAVAPDGKNLYVVSVGGDVIAQYTIGPATGKITPLSPAAITLPSGSLGLAVAPQ
jgi:6-phosphogluconolactonase